MLSTLNVAIVQRYFAAGGHGVPNMYSPDRKNGNAPIKMIIQHKKAEAFGR